MIKLSEKYIGENFQDIGRGRVRFNKSTIHERKTDKLDLIKLKTLALQETLFKK